MSRRSIRKRRHRDDEKREIELMRVMRLAAPRHQYPRSAYDRTPITVDTGLINLSGAT